MLGTTRSTDSPAASRPLPSVGSAASIVVAISAPVGQACTHSPQPTQLESPIGSSRSKTIFAAAPRPAMPITSLAWMSRQACTHSWQWMQASSCTVMAGWLRSASAMGAASAMAARGGKRLPRRSSDSAHCQNKALRSCACARGGCSVSSSSITSRRLCSARSEVSLRTRMPALTWREQLGASWRSPSISTMHARQLPPGR